MRLAFASLLYCTFRVNLNFNIILFCLPPSLYVLLFSFLFSSLRCYTFYRVVTFVIVLFIYIHWWYLCFALLYSLFFCFFSLFILGSLFGCSFQIFVYPVWCIPIERLFVYWLVRQPLLTLFHFAIVHEYWLPRCWFLNLLIIFFTVHLKPLIDELCHH